MLRVRIAAVGVMSAALLYACGGRDEVPQTQDAGTNPCVGAGCATTDAGTGGEDGGNNTGGTDGGNLQEQQTVTIAELRSGDIRYGQSVKLENVVVTAISYKQQGSAGDWQADFWVADPNDPASGMWIQKEYQDLPKAYETQLGDVLTIEGWYGTNKPFDYFDFNQAYRQVVKRQFDFVQSGGKPMNFTVIEAAGAPLADVDTSSVPGFGDAQDGNARANQEFGGARVSIPGPLKLTNTDPTPLDIYSLGERVSSAGFELTGGILVADNQTDNTCDWREIAADAGRFNQEVVFPNGVSGVWDSYSHSPCLDGGTGGGCFRASGYVPGTSFDGGTQPNRWTNVLWPQDCADLQGVVQDIQAP